MRRFKNFFSYALTTGAFNWIMVIGVWKTFWIMGTAQVAVCALAIPMCKLPLLLLFLFFESPYLFWGFVEVMMVKAN